MMLAYLGWPEEEKRLEAICAKAIATGHSTPDVGGQKGTRAVADFVLAELRASPT
jgi:3-isopropylmalate dehydrogenase